MVFQPTLPDEGGLSDPDMPVAFFKNLMETPLSVEHPSFKEEFIFNKGLPDEVKFHLEPKQLVDATEVPS